MSTLSKVFVVLVLVLSVVFAMTSMSRLATTEDFKQKFTDEEEAKDEALAKARTADQKRKEWEDKYSDLKKTTNSEIAVKQQQIDTLTADKTTAQSENKELKTTFEVMKADLANLSVQVGEKDKIIERLRKEKDAAVVRSSEDLNKRQDAEQGLKDSQLRVKNLREEVMNLKEHVTMWMTKATQLDTLIKTYEVRARVNIGSVVGRPEAAQPKIEGVVTDVMRDGDEVWVQLSVGSTNDVKKGTTFIIYGADGYKGDMHVMTVLPDSSVGRLTGPVAKEILKGDKATTRLRTSP